MKTSIILILIISCYNLQAQNPPIVEKGAPQSNNLLPSGGTLGSNSGVNPKGNPGTIASYSGNSNSVNTKVDPNPNIEPGTFLNSSPEGTEIRTTTDNTVNTQTTTTITANGGTSTATVNEPAKVPVNVPVIKETKIANMPVVVNPTPTRATNVKPITVTDKGKALPAFSPVLGNYVPEQIINKIKAKYGSSVYDIRTVRIASNNKIAYIVRLVDNGKFRNELYYDEP